MGRLGRRRDTSNGPANDAHTGSVPGHLGRSPSRLRRTRPRSWAFLAVLAVGSGLLGVLVTLVIGAPLGEDHSCPRGASVTACHYPPNTQSWMVSWGIGGILFGLAIAIVVAAVVGRDSPHRRPQKHLLVQGPPD